MITPQKTQQVLLDIAEERDNQIKKWGIQHHPDGTGESHDRALADAARKRCQLAAAAGHLTWRHISDEETAEAYAETDPITLRKELIQQAAVCVAWIEDIDSRKP